MGMGWDDDVAMRFRSTVRLPQRVCGAYMYKQKLSEWGKELLPYRMRYRKWKENVARNQQRRGETKINSFFRFLAGIFLFAPLLSPPPSQIRTERKRGGSCAKKVSLPTPLLAQLDSLPSSFLPSVLPSAKAIVYFFFAFFLSLLLQFRRRRCRSPTSPPPHFSSFLSVFLPSFPEEC